MAGSDFLNNFCYFCFCSFFRPLFIIITRYFTHSISNFGVFRPVAGSTSTTPKADSTLWFALQPLSRLAQLPKALAQAHHPLECVPVLLNLPNHNCYMDLDTMTNSFDTLRDIAASFR